VRKLTAAINMTLDGFCDHTAITPDQTIHQHYADLLKDAGVALYGRITYHLMEYWRTVLDNPTGNKQTDDFAVQMDRIPKIVFSRTLKDTDWATATLATHDLKTEVETLKQQDGKDILACSPSLIVQLTNLNLVDEYQICIHPVLAVSGLPLFRNLSEKATFKLTDTKVFNSGAVILYYQPAAV
jgi:dihydrofolate reductase